MSQYVATGGQTRLPSKENSGVPFLPFQKCAAPNLPMIDIRPDLQGQWAMTCESQHFIPGVTAEMLDWFWGNIEKCYYLWAPGAHKEIRWIRPAWSTGLVGSSLIFVEQEEPGGPFKIIPDEDPCVNLGMDAFVFNDCMEHVIIQGTPGVFVNVHMWEDVPGGCVHRMCAAANQSKGDQFPIPLEFGEITLNELAHPEYEAAMWPRFLPQMYALWRDHPDPTQNIRWDLSVKKTGDYRWEYLCENGPAVL